MTDSQRFQLKRRGVAQPGSAPQWGCGGREFESRRPDHFNFQHIPATPDDRRSSAMDGTITQASTTGAHSLGRPGFAISLVFLMFCILTGCDRQNLSGVTLFKEGRYKEAHDALEIEARRGSAEAQNLLGISLQLGLSGGRDEIRAVEWFTRAALQRHSGAQVNLGVAYMNGSGIGQNKATAFGWFQLAADGGNARARAYLAVLTDKLTPNQMVRARKMIAKLVAQSAPP